MNITKNIQSRESLEKIAKNAFPEKEMIKYKELSEGLCNIAYRIDFSDGSKSILKIAPQFKKSLLRNEKSLMNAEVNAMRIAENTEGLHIPKVQYYDRSKILCTGDYFFMDCLEGVSFSSIVYSADSDKNALLGEEQKSSIYCEIGQAVRKLADIKGEYFGQLYDGAEKFTDMSDFLKRLLENVIADADEKNIVIGVAPDEIISRFEADRKAFDDVSPVLVHYDLWEGNIFIQDDHVCGIIDWERALWGDVLMEDRFRRHSKNDDFLKGYGKTEFSETEHRRMLWYDVLLYLTMMTEGKFREYPDDSQYQWVKPLFDLSWGELNNGENI